MGSILLMLVGASVGGAAVWFYWEVQVTPLWEEIEDLKEALRRATKANGE